MAVKSTNQAALELAVHPFLSDARQFEAKVKALAKEQKLSFRMDSRRLEQDWNTASKKMQSGLTSLTKEAEGLLSKVKVDELRAKFLKIAPEWEAAQAKVLLSAQALMEKGLDKIEKQKREDAKKDALDELHAVEKRLAVEADAVQDMIKKKQLAQAKAEKWAGTSRAEKYAGAAATGFAAVKGADFAAGGGFAKMFGAWMHKKGEAAKEKGAEKAGTGMGKALEKLGGAVGFLGKGLILIGGLAAGLAALVAIVIELDAKTKAWNKALVEAGVSGGDLINTGMDMGTAFERARKAFTDSKFTMRWNKLPEESMKVVGALQEAGVSINTLVKGTQKEDETVKSLQDHVGAMYGMAGALGIEVTQLADTVGQYMDELNLSFEGVKEGLDGIFKAAMASGFGTKRFFSQVLQATTGMSMYNVRLEDTAKLLLRLTKILGIRAGGEMLQSLTKGFMGESRTDSAKRILTTGKGVSGRIIAADTKLAIDQMRKDITTRLKGGPGGLTEEAKAGVYAAAEAKDIHLDTDSSDDIAAKMAKLSRRDQAELIGQAMKADDKLGRELQKISDQARGQTGNLMDMASAIDSLGSGGVLAMQLNTGMGVFKKPLSQLNSIEMAAAESSMGISRDQMKQLRLIDATMRAQYKDAKEKGLTDDTFEEYVTKNGAQVADAVEAMGTPMEQATQQLVQNTMSISDVIEHKTNGILNRIAGYVSDIAAWVVGGESKETKTLKTQKAKQVGQVAAGFQERADALGKQIGEETAKAARLKPDSDERRLADAHIEDLKAQRDADIKQAAKFYDAQRAILSADLSEVSGGSKSFWQTIGLSDIDLTEVQKAVDALAYGKGGLTSADEAAKADAQAQVDADKAATPGIVRAEDQTAPTGYRKTVLSKYDQMLAEQKKVREDAQKASITRGLVAAGYTGDIAAATAAIAGGTLPEDVLQVLRAPKPGGRKGETGLSAFITGGGELPTEQFIQASQPPAKDFILGKGGITRFAAGDLVMGVDETAARKAGGRAGGGLASNVNVYNYFYQDAQGNYRSMQNLLDRAGLA